MKVSITDHVLLRYIERVHGLNLDPLRREIADLISGPAQAGASSFTTANGFTFCFRENEGGQVVVTTVLQPGWRNKKPVPHRRRLPEHAGRPA